MTNVGWIGRKAEAFPLTARPRIAQARCGLLAKAKAGGQIVSERACCGSPFPPPRPRVFDPKIAPQKAIGILYRPRYEVPVGHPDQKFKFGTERLGALRQRNLEAIACGEMVRVIIYCSGIPIHGNGKLIPFRQQPIDRQRRREAPAPALSTKSQADTV